MRDTALYLHHRIDQFMNHSERVWMILLGMLALMVIFQSKLPATVFSVAWLSLWTLRGVLSFWLRSSRTARG